MFTHTRLTRLSPQSIEYWRPKIMPFYDLDNPNNVESLLHAIKEDPGLYSSAAQDSWDCQAGQLGFLWRLQKFSNADVNSLESQCYRSALVGVLCDVTPHKYTPKTSHDILGNADNITRVKEWVQAPASLSTADAIVPVSVSAVMPAPGPTPTPAPAPAPAPAPTTATSTPAPTSLPAAVSSMDFHVYKPLEVDEGWVVDEIGGTRVFKNQTLDGIRNTIEAEFPVQGHPNAAKCTIRWKASLPKRVTGKSMFCNYTFSPDSGQYIDFKICRFNENFTEGFSFVTRNKKNQNGKRTVYVTCYGDFRFSDEMVEALGLTVLKFKAASSSSSTSTGTDHQYALLDVPAAMLREDERKQGKTDNNTTTAAIAAAGNETESEQGFDSDLSESNFSAPQRQPNPYTRDRSAVIVGKTQLGMLKTKRQHQALMTTTQQGQEQNNAADTETEEIVESTDIGVWTCLCGYDNDSVVFPYMCGACETKRSRGKRTATDDDMANFTSTSTASDKKKQKLTDQ